MIVQCEKCSAKFKIDEAKLSPQGTSVRCSRCKHVFKAHRPSAPAQMAVEERKPASSFEFVVTDESSEELQLAAPVAESNNHNSPSPVAEPAVDDAQEIAAHLFDDFEPSVDALPAATTIPAEPSVPRAAAATPAQKSAAAQLMPTQNSVLEKAAVALPKRVKTKKGGTEPSIKTAATTSHSEGSHAVGSHAVGSHNVGSHAVGSHNAGPYTTMASPIQSTWRQGVIMGVVFVAALFLGLQWRGVHSLSALKQLIYENHP